MTDRPFIEFIQAQVIDWSAAPLAEVRPGVETRTLSVDATSGASSVMLRYPSGWTRTVGEVLGVDEEFFVLSGALSVGGREYGRYSYGHLPAGYHRAGMASPAGAVVMTWFTGPPEAVAADGHGADLVPERVVEHVDALAGEWGGNFHPRFPPGAGRKWLRRDPVTQDETWVLGTMPLRSGRRAERHPVVEEMLLISGELHGHVGVMRPGAYFWRPPHEPHGPFGSLTGNVLLFRTVGGPLSTVYDDEEVDFTWDPPDRAILPDDLAALPRYDGPVCRCW